jgi:hypothetical protein
MMQRKSLTTALAIAGAACLVATAPSFAQTTDDHNTTTGGATATTTEAAHPMGAGTDSRRTPSARHESMGMHDSATNGRHSFDKTGKDEWADTQARQHNGRISREAYMDEMSRRWDTMDHNQQGLTPAEVSRLYGNVDSAAGPARTGSGAQAGNMGPGSQKAQ